MKRKEEDGVWVEGREDILTPSTIKIHRQNF